MKARGWVAQSYGIASYTPRSLCVTGSAHYQWLSSVDDLYFGISNFLGPPLHFWFHSHSFISHPLRAYFLVSWTCLWNLAGPLPDLTALALYIPMKLAPHEWSQSILPAQVIVRIPWIMATVASESLDGWTWGNSSLCSCFGALFSKQSQSSYPWISLNLWSRVWPVPERPLSHLFLHPDTKFLASFNANLLPPIL